MTKAEAYFRSHVAQYCLRLQEDLNVGKWDSCAIMGNAGHECNGFTTLQEVSPTVAGSRGGYGWMQWTGPRRRAFETWAKSNGLNVADMETNYKFLVYELTKTPEASAVAKIKNVITLDDKVEVFERAFLRAGYKHYDSRKRWARIALEELDKVIADTAKEPPAPPPKVTLPPTQPVNEKPATPVIVAVLMALAALAATIWHYVGGSTP